MCPDQGQQIATIGNKLINKKSWESLSSTFSNLEISFSHDSCYASDEVSTTSTNPTTVDTSTVSPSIHAAEAAKPPPLKPILKRPFAEIEEDEESESGYTSGPSAHEYEYDALSDDDDDVYYVTAWDEDSDAFSEYYGEDDALEDDGSFISFESTVRFDSNVLYIDAPPSYEDSTPGPEMTCHEMMELARTSGNLPNESPSGDCEGYGGFSDSPRNLSEEHTDDILDLDKRLFVAYMNGIGEIPNANYKERLRDLAYDIQIGQAKSPYLEADNACGVYLDHALNHVLGTFRSVVAKEELDRLVNLSEEKDASVQEPGITERPSQDLLNQIGSILSERLGGEAVTIGPEELDFFAGGIAFAIQNWRSYTTR
ncbi:hypothetical protein BDV59DRAFT_114030 [Aspergillus ambiguus]|uniref:uncharacterized protein n=1 Tax=Aspergillus ambiguus TaxID=176160 RepID=UPI003CCD5A21